MSRAAAEEELRSAYQLKYAQKAVNMEKSEQANKESQKEEGENLLDCSQVCLFELKEQNSCWRKNRCRFEHEIPATLRSNTDFIQQVITSHSNRMAFCAVELVAKGSCNPEECRFNHVWDKSNLRRKMGMEEKGKGNGDKRKKAMCYRELMEKGSCTFKERCHFSHDFPESLRDDSEFVQKTMQERIKKQGLCVNEFVQEGTCEKKECCRFSHKITKEQREDPVLKEKMKVQLKKISLKNKEASHTVSNAGDSNVIVSINDINSEMADLRKMIMELKKHF